MLRLLFLCSLVLVFAACSDDSTTVVEEPAEASRAPGTLTVESVATNNIILGWRDLSDDESGFQIERRPAGDVSDFEAIGTVNLNEVRYIDRTVVSGSLYEYQVRSIAEDERTLSDPSETVTARATQNNSPSVPFNPSPANLTQNIAPDSSIVLTWAATDDDGETLLYDVLFGQTRASMEPIATAQTSTELALSDLRVELNRSYFWQVIVRDGAGVTRRSPVWVFVARVERVNVPNGEFVMGTDENTPFFHPGNPVRVSDFNLDKFEVTNQQYATFLNQSWAQGLITVVNGEVFNGDRTQVLLDVAPPTARSPIGDRDSAIRFLTAEQLFVVVEGWETYPVVEVSWYGANAYANFFNRRLPSEAEWEKAARGLSTELGTRTFIRSDTVVIGLGFPYPWGPQADLTRGNFDNSGDPFENQGNVRSTPVGFYDGTVRSGYATSNGESFYGAADMAGNVWEWVDDWHDTIYRQPHTPPTTGIYKVIRGGSYRAGLGSARVTNRSLLGPSSRDRAVGFRTAATGLTQ